jgi:hypothetical protein
MTLAQVSGTGCVPIVVNWESIEDMAHKRRQREYSCPLCGGPKDRGLICSACLGLYGEMGTSLVKAEIGRKISPDRPHLWAKMIGENLSLLWGKRNGHNQKKSKKKLMPVDDLPVSAEQITEIQVLEEKVPEAIQEIQVAKIETPVLQEVEAIKEISTPKEVVSLPDRQVEIMPGMMIWHNVAVAMVCGVTKNRWVCAFCKEPKDDRKWMCGGCYKKFKEQGILALKTYLAKLNHNFNIHPEGSHVPSRKEEVVILAIADKLLSSNFRGHISCHPRELAKTLTTLKGVNEKIPLLILTIIAREALRRRAESNRKEAPIQKKKDPPSEKPELAGLSVIPLGMKNLKEDKDVARYFLAFLSAAYRRWIVIEKANGRKPTEGKFAKKVSYNVASWHYLKYPEKYPNKSGISIKKASEISEKLGTSLEDALVIGQTLIKEMID